MRRTGIEIAFLCIGLVATTFASAVVPVAAEPATQPRATKSFTLYGDGMAPGNGWGFTAGTITQPGPTLYVNQSDTVQFTLFSADGLQHELVIDWNSDGIKNGADVNSSTFSSATSGTPWSFVADQAGTHQYFCGVHGANLQKGTLIVNGTGGTPAASDNTTLIIGGVVIVVAVVAVAAAVAMRRKPKPPVQP